MLTVEWTGVAERLGAGCEKEGSRIPVTCTTEGWTHYQLRRGGRRWSQFVGGREGVQIWTCQV